MGRKRGEIWPFIGPKCQKTAFRATLCISYNGCASRERSPSMASKRRRRGKIGDGGIHAGVVASITPLFAAGLLNRILLCEAAAAAAKGDEGMDASKPSRRVRHHIKVWCSQDEKALIEGIARDAGLSASSYLRVIGLGYKPRSVVDLAQVRRLTAINGDLGRMGGLLKLWLTDDQKLDEFGDEAMRRIVRGLLSKIEGTQQLMRETIEAILYARS